MQRLYFSLTLLVLLALLAGCASNSAVQPVEVKALEKSGPTEAPLQSEVVSQNPAADCPVTAVEGQPAFAAPAPYSANAPWPSEFWFGSKHLWTALNDNGVWSGLPDNPEGYTQKIFWWSDLFSLKDEPQPNLMVTGQRLDAKAPLLKVSRATNAFAEDIGSAMLVGVDFPTLGCWQITGNYEDAELSFVVWVAP